VRACKAQEYASCHEKDEDADLLVELQKLNHGSKFQYMIYGRTK
jgi:hypothetical protein